MIKEDAKFKPDSLFELPIALTDRWVVLRTRSRQEKRVSEQLSALLIPFYLPLVRRIHYYGKRKTAFDVPLFAGYLFMRGALEKAYEIDRAGRIASILPVADQFGLNVALKSISIAQANQVQLDLYPHLSVGRQVEVRAGPLRGMRGRVEALKHSINRLVVNVDMLGRAVSLEIDGSLLDAV